LKELYRIRPLFIERYQYDILWNLYDYYNNTLDDLESVKLLTVIGGIIRKIYEIEEIDKAEEERMAKNRILTGNSPLWGLPLTPTRNRHPTRRNRKLSVRKKLLTNFSKTKKINRSTIGKYNKSHYTHPYKNYRKVISGQGYSTRKKRKQRRFTRRH
jgi:hypothetical protein